MVRSRSRSFRSRSLRPRSRATSPAADSRNDAKHVLPWAFQEAKLRHANGFLFLGDMEITPGLDEHFWEQLRILDPVPFFPVLGNHETRVFGFIKHDTAEAVANFRKRFLDTPRTPVHSSIANKVVYSIDLPGGVHFISLDNVSQKGFGAEQLAWLTEDLESSHHEPNVKFIVVGMHKPLAHNGISKHGMEQDGAKAVADSEAAAQLFITHKVALVLASHVHGFGQYSLGGIPSYITGGLGAPLSDKIPKESQFHHFLEIEVGPSALEVRVVRFTGGFDKGEEDEDD